MELEKFQVFYRCSGLPSQGDALTAGLGWVGGVGEQVPTTTTGEDDGPRADPVQLAAIEHLHSTAAIVFDPKFGDAYATAMDQVWAFVDPVA